MSPHSLSFPECSIPASLPPWEHLITAEGDLEDSLSVKAEAAAAAGTLLLVTA